MSSILTSEGMVLATAMAVSGTVILLAFRLQKSTLHQFEMMVNAIPPGQAPVSLPRSCISPANSPSSSSSDGKKKDKKKKRVHFAADVVDPIGNSDEYRKNFHSNNNRGTSNANNHSNPALSTTQKDHNHGGKTRGMPANRAALYSGILRDRVLHRTTYSSY